MCLPWLTGSVVMQHFTVDVHGGTKLLTFGSESKKESSIIPLKDTLTDSKPPTRLHLGLPPSRSAGLGTTLEDA